MQIIPKFQTVFLKPVKQTTTTLIELPDEMDESSNRAIVVSACEDALVRAGDEVIVAEGYKDVYGGLHEIYGEKVYICHEEDIIAIVYDNETKTTV